MTTLTKRGIQELVSKKKHGFSTGYVAQKLKVSPRRVQQLFKEYLRTGSMPVLKQERRPKKPLTAEQKRLIDQVYDHHQVGARVLKIALDEDYPGNGISQNKIHAYLRETGRAHADPRKQKQRKRCRYERRHTGSLVHMDTHYCKWKPGLYLMTCLDDASRHVLAAHEVSNITAHNAIKTLMEAICSAARYNVLIHAVNTDRGSEFFPSRQGKKERKIHDFRAFLARHEIRHIPSRVKNPQTNGKLERWHQEYIKHRHRFASLKECIAWYNNRIHGELRTRPCRAFIAKLRPETLIGLLFRRMEHEDTK
jgi:putative transposase